MTGFFVWGSSVSRYTSIRRVMVDEPPGSNIRNQNINVFSVSYNFVF